MNSELEAAYAAAQAEIAKTENRAGREPGSVGLLAVSKSQPAPSIKQLYALGQRHFAENYLQEALEKQAQLQEQAITWHFIGRIQRRKARQVAEHFSWVHTVDSEQLAGHLDKARGEAGLPPLQVCLQVNISEDPQKGGVLATDVVSLAEAVLHKPNLKLRGLMTILKADQPAEGTLADYRGLADLQDTLNRQGHRLDTLSMGMSQDFGLAIAAGATWVRVGRGLFGKRD